MLAGALAVRCRRLARKLWVLASRHTGAVANKYKYVRPDVPYKYDMFKFVNVGSVSVDHIDPSICASLVHIVFSRS